MSKIYTFKEIVSKEELEKCMLLRYKVYSTSANKIFIQENKTQIDIDSYDVHSRHYCLFINDNTAAYLRIVFPKEELINETILEIGEEYSLLNRKEYRNQNKKAPFPFLSYKGISMNQLDFFNELTKKQEKLTEVSRLIVFPEYSSLKTAKHLVECAVVIYAVMGIGQSHTIINCLSEHAAFYKSYGFTAVANGEEYLLEGLNKMCVTLVLPLVPSLVLSMIPKKYHEQIELMTKEFKQTGKIIKQL